jgi:hypothetical protein
MTQPTWTTSLRAPVSARPRSTDRDWSLVADVVLAMGLLEVVRGQSVDAKFVRHVIDTLVLPAVQTPPIEAPNH